MKIENIDTTLEEIQEVGEQMRVINEAISQPVGGFQVCCWGMQRVGLLLGYAGNGNASLVCRVWECFWGMEKVGMLLGYAESRNASKGCY
jgi:hypothetical protein